jgi:tetratricopeptide (TPR) repeat protein
MLILDDLCDAVLLEARQGSQSCNGSRQPLLSYIPHGQNGSILITTRVRDAALRFVEAHDIIQTPPMDQTSALALLQKKLGMAWRRNDDHAVAELIVALEYMPLAIVQAAAYISERSPRCSIEQYLERFMRNDSGKTMLLKYDGGQRQQDREAEKSVIVTWQISFDYIHRAQPSAADLLSLMSFFDEHGIPKALLRGQRLENIGDNEERSDSNADSDDRGGLKNASHLGTDDWLEDDIAMLRNYSFISVNQDCTTFEMYALVQLAMRKWLEANGKAEAWKQKAINNLCAAFPTGEHKNWVICQALFPHVRSLVLQQPKKVEGLRDWASLLHRAAGYALGRGNVDDAIIMLTKSMKARKQLFGNKHEETLASMGMLGSAYNLGGRWTQAEELQLQVIETRKRVLGAEHPDTLNSMNNLALTYWNQGRWTQAEELQLQVMETRKRVLGGEHPDTLTSISNLALTYWNQGRWAKAEGLEVQVMETRKRVLGTEHPDTLTSINNLALTYWNQGRWKEAEELFVQVKETRKRVLGTEHPDTLTSIANLASTYRNQGRWTEAEQLEVQVMETTKRVLGAEHPDTLTSMANLASTYRNQGRWTEAEQLEVQVMETSKRVLGQEHPDTLASMANLASTFSNLGRWKEAEVLEVQAMETRERVLGQEHPSTLTSMGNLASTYRNQGRWKEAEELEVQVMETSLMVLGQEHPSTLTSMANLASTYRNQGRWTEAEELELQVMEIRKTKLGADHPDTLISMNNLAFTWKGQGRNTEAIGLMRECVRCQQHILGLDHPHFVSSSRALAGWEVEPANTGALSASQRHSSLRKR